LVARQKQQAGVQRIGMRSDCAGADDWQWRYVIALGVWCRCRRNLSLSQGVGEAGLMLMTVAIAIVSFLFGFTVVANFMLLLNVHRLQKQVEAMSVRLSMAESNHFELSKKVNKEAITDAKRTADWGHLTTSENPYENAWIFRENAKSKK
jgi:hypothetical protein